MWYSFSSSGNTTFALLMVEHVIKSHKILDVFLMLESYINIMVERVDLIEHQRVCLDEFKEAVLGLVYAASRCGNFTGLQELRAAFTSRYGKEFVAFVVDLCNNCGVNPKVNIGQVLLSVKCKEFNGNNAHKALRRSKFKFPGRQKIIVSPKWGFTKFSKADCISFSYSTRQFLALLQPSSPP